MKIRWLGHASFLIEGQGVRIVTDPYDQIGIEFPKVEADVVTSSHDHFDHNATDKVAGNPSVVRGVGTHEAAGVKFEGIGTYHDETRGSQRGKNTVFCFELEGIRVCHAGDLGHTLDEETVSKIGRVDVLMVPVGGTYTVTAEGAEQVVEALNPKVVIPMHFRIEGLALPISDESAFVAKFARVERVDELELAPHTLPQELTVYVLKPHHG